MEKALNDMLNSYFKDSSYLNDVYDSVSSALFETTSSQGRNQSVETEFIVQKWLGSLYSVGGSSSAIQQIAQGIGNLGSGNVQALSGTPMQTLLALSASKAGLDYAGMLTSGITASETNRLLKAMVEYLSEIADSTSENKVVTSAFGNVLGLSLSDIKSFKNLAANSSDIFNENMTFKSSQDYLQNQLNKYTQYMGTAQYMENIISNLNFGAGMTFADGGQYVAYKILDMIDQLTGGGPQINLEYWGIGTSFKPIDLIKTALFGVGLINSLRGGLGQNALNLNTWGYEDVVSRGTGFGLKADSGTSFNQNVGNNSSDDMNKQTLEEGVDKSKEVEEASGKENKKDVDDLYEAMVYPSDKGMLTQVSMHTQSINYDVKKALELLDQVSQIGNRKSLNINVQKIAGKDVGSGNDVALTTSPNADWIKIITAAAALIKYGTIMNGFGGQAIQQIQSQENQQEHKTLEDFLDIIVPMLEGTDGIPVGLKEIDYSALLKLIAKG